MIISLHVVNPVANRVVNHDGRFYRLVLNIVVSLGPGFHIINNSENRARVVTFEARNYESIRSHLLLETLNLLFKLCVEGKIKIIVETDDCVIVRYENSIHIFV